MQEDKRIQDTETVAVKNDGTELRITRISEDDTGDYTCVADNTEGSVHATTKVILAGERPYTQHTNTHTSLRQVDDTRQVAV